MANKLTSEGLTVGYSTLTNIVRDWGGGYIFSGFKNLLVDDSAVVDDLLPAIEVGEFRFYRVRSHITGNRNEYNITLPSGGLYQWRLDKRRINLCSTGIDFYTNTSPDEYNLTYGISPGGTMIRSGGMSIDKWPNILYINACYCRLS